jgi:hypothetical protein
MFYFPTRSDAGVWERECFNRPSAADIPSPAIFERKMDGAKGGGVLGDPAE